MTIMHKAVTYIDYGVGHTINGKVYMNKRLLHYPELHDKILEHELKHVRGEHHVDFKEKADWGIIKFILTNPSAWVQYLPVWIIKGPNGIVINYDRTIVFMWATLSLLAISFVITALDPRYGLFLAGLNILVAALMMKWLK